MKTETVDGVAFETWTVDEVQKAFDANDIVLIDVRTPQEYMFEHIEGALLFPMSFFAADKLPSQDGKRIVFHCGSGVRSARVATACAKAGIIWKVALAAGRLRARPIWAPTWPLAHQ